MLYGTSRQAFALGRAGYLPRFLGAVHQQRRTPVPALLTCSLVSAGFILAYFWYKDAIDIAVLVSTLTALVWYILAMVCLLLLRRSEPHLSSAYRAPLPRLLPVLVILLSAFAAYVYSGIEHAREVLPLTVALYGLGLGYYWFWARARLEHAAPEELAARQGAERGAPSAERKPLTVVGPSRLGQITAIVLGAVVLSLAWIIAAAYGGNRFRFFSGEAEVSIMIVMLAAALILVSVLALRHTRSTLDPDAPASSSAHRGHRT
jgi:amino acid transporter